MGVFLRRMSISNSQLASDLGWDNGWEIPVANEENKTLSSQLAAKTREKDLYSAEIETVSEKCKNLKTHLKAVRDELNNNLSMRQMRQNEVNTEKHFAMIAERERGRLQQICRQLDKQLEDQFEQRNLFENKLFTNNSKIEELKNQMMWDQHALEAWLEESARRDEDALVIQKYKKQDDSKIKELQLLIEKLTDDRNKARRGLESETTETLTSQIELEKLAEEFKRAHSDRQDLINTWETTISKLKERDEELVQEEMKNVDIKEELIAREQIIKEKRAFLSTESENNIELEKKIEIRERQNGKIREQRQYIEARTTEMADSVKTLQHQAERARKENDIKLNQIEESKIKIEKMESKLSQSQSSKREIEQRIDEVRKGMLNAAEIAKQADAMLAEREQEMKELEQQKRRARMQGEVNNEEKTALEERLAELNGTLEEKHKTKKILDEQQRKLQVNLRRCQVEMEKCTREHDALNSKIEELELYDDSSQRELKSLIKEKQDAMVENNILKLQVKRVRDSLYHTADNVHDLKHRCLRLTTALK